MTEPTNNDQEVRGLTAKLFDKLRLVMGAVGSIKKDGFNDHHKYAYVRDQDVKDAVREAMLDNNLMWFPSCTRVEQEGNHTASTFIVTIVDTETGFTWQFPWFGEANDTQDKGFGKSSTLGFKYLWLTMLLIGVEDDPDGSAPVERGDRPQSSRQTSNTPVEAADPAQFKLRFGKHKGKTVAEIGGDPDDSGWLKWALENLDNDERNAELLTTIKAYFGMLDGNAPQAEQGHWTETQDWQAFYAAAGSLGLSNADVHTALKVKSAKDYLGTKGQAWNALVQFATETVVGWPNHSKLLEEWFRFLNSLPADKRPSPGQAVKLLGDGPITEFNDTLAVAMNIVRGKIE